MTFGWFGDPFAMSLGLVGNQLISYLMGQAPCRRPPKVDFGESILETGTSWLENCGSEARFWMKKWSEIGLGRVFGRSGEALGRSLGGFCDLGGFLEALGGSLDRFLEALGRIWESKWSEFWFEIEEKTIDKSDLNLVSILDGILIVSWGSWPWVRNVFICNP